MLKRLSEVYAAKVEASRSNGILRISADHDTASDVLKLLRYILETVRKVELDLPSGTSKELSHLLNQTLLEQTGQLTNTIIRTPEASLVKDNLKKVTHCYVG